MHATINRFLAIIVVILGLYIVLSPVLPQIRFWVENDNFTTPAYVSAEGEPTSAPVPATNKLIIPKLGVDAEIYQGLSESIVDKGLWHRPNTPTPLEQGNSVIVGHRFSYNPGLNQPFYHLDKLTTGDTLIVLWDKTILSYTVRVKKVVKANQVEVEGNTINTQLTLYTCTPLFNPVDRLVIVAEPKVVTNE